MIGRSLDSSSSKWTRCSSKMVPRVVLDVPGMASGLDLDEMCVQMDEVRTHVRPRFAREKRCFGRAGRGITRNRGIPKKQEGKGTPLHSGKARPTRPTPTLVRRTRTRPAIERREFRPSIDLEGAKELTLRNIGGTDNG